MNAMLTDALIADGTERRAERVTGLIKADS